MGPVKSCCRRPLDDKLMIAKMDLSHCGCLEVPHVVFNAERCIETLILASNQISSLPPQLFHCQEMKHLNLIDNCLSSIPPAIGSFLHLVSLKLDKNNLQELPEDLKMCKKLRRLSLSSNPWKQVPNVVTQLISLEELYMNDCELNYLSASVGRLSKLKILELRNNNLCNLPLSMRRLESLNRLDISDNEFNEFPPCIPKLKSLKELLIDNNEIEEIIDIKNLVNLEHFDASYNHIIKVSETIGCCTHLIMLNLSFNYIEQLPNSVGNITSLQTFQLEMNELSEIPKSIGKLSYLEELNLCNNKLHTLPSTTGLLRNLRNINVSRNIIEEFPPDIGSCSKLGIINAAYNRLRVLPSEIGYLNNLKVLDLVGNFLMYLPITIINIRGIRAIWLSANQNVPLIPFTEDLNIASGERFLTNIALPQLGEIPSNANSGESKAVNNEKSSMWNKKISFAEDDDLLPGKLHRTPTPFPKELRAPNRKHQKNEESKRNDNYVNVIDGKVAEQETVFPVPCVSLQSNGKDIPDGFGTQIREANIRRNNRDLAIDTITQSQNDCCDMYVESEYSHDFPECKRTPETESKLAGFVSRNYGPSLDNVALYEKPPETKIEESAAGEKVELNISEPQRINNNKEDSLVNGCSVAQAQFRISTNSSPTLPPPLRGDGSKDSEYSKDKFNPSCILRNDEENSNVTRNGSFRRQVIYSNLVNDNRENTGDVVNSSEDTSEEKAQKIREMYHNDIIYGSSKNTEFRTVGSRAYCRGNCINGNVENSPKHLYLNNPQSKELGFVQSSFNNINREVCKRIYRESSIPLPPPPSLNDSFKNKTANTVPAPTSSPELKQPLSKEDFISLAEQMKNRNIAPPCYEIAKMYSTKAALFENNRVDQLKSN